MLKKQTEKKPKNHHWQTILNSAHALKMKKKATLLIKCQTRLLEHFKIFLNELRVLWFLLVSSICIQLSFFFTRYGPRHIKPDLILDEDTVFHSSVCPTGFMLTLCCFSPLKQCSVQNLFLLWMHIPMQSQSIPMGFSVSCNERRNTARKVRLRRGPNTGTLPSIHHNALICLHG